MNTVWTRFIELLPLERGLGHVKQVIAPPPANVHPRLMRSLAMLLTLMLSFVSCSRVYAEPTQREAESAIERQIPAQLRPLAPLLTYGAAHCPTTLHLADQHRERCSMRIDNRDFPVDILSDGFSLQPALRATLIDGRRSCSRSPKRSPRSCAEPAFR